MGLIAASNHTANTDTSIPGIDMSNLRRLITLMDVGVINGTSNIQLYYYSSANANMAGSTNLGNAAGFTVQVVNVANTVNGRIETLEIRADQLPAGHRYVRPVVTVGGTAAFLSVIVLGGESAYKPANQFVPANTVDQALVMG